MKLALFDLDHTIIDVDSDYLWSEFLVDKGLLDAEEAQKKNDEFYEQYLVGELDPIEHFEYVATFFSQHSMETLLALRDEYIETVITSKIRPQAMQTIQNHIEKGHQVVLSSATNDFIVDGVAQVLNIPLDNVLASKLDVNNNQFTGKLAGTANFQAGKVTNLQTWLADKPDIEESWAYSDSYNDKPLLEFADHAFAVTPDERLTEHAKKVGWQILDWAL